MENLLIVIKEIFKWLLNILGIETPSINTVTIIFIFISASGIIAIIGFSALIQWLIEKVNKLRR